MQHSARLESLTFLRFVAASVVVIFHFAQGTSFFPALPTVLKAGPMMVTFFFVLSGFVISVSHVGRKVSTLEFYKNRIARIAPVYFIALIASGAVSTSTLTPKEIFLTSVFLQAWIPQYALSINSPAWSLSVEAFFYLLCPALIILAGHREKINTKAWILTSVAVWALTQAVLSALQAPGFYLPPPSYSHNLINYFPVSHLCSFLLGFTSGILFKNRNTQNIQPNYLIPIGLIVSALSISIAIEYRSSINMFFGARFAFTSSFLSILFVIFVYFCAVSDKSIGKFFSPPVIVILGEASYSMYILQKPIHAIFNDIEIFHSLNEDLKFLAFFTVLTLISVACHLLVERPSTLFIKNFFRTHRHLTV